MAARARRLARIASGPRSARPSQPSSLLAAVAAAAARAAPPPEKAQRIVSLVPAVTEMLFAIGAGPQVVGVSSYDHFPPEVEALPKVGALLDPDTERILSLRPDLVVVYGSQAETEARFKKAGIRTFNYRHGVEGAILADARHDHGARRGDRPRRAEPARWSPASRRASRPCARASPGSIGRARCS